MTALTQNDQTFNENASPYSQVPTALAVFAGDSTIRKFAETQHNVVRWTEFARGGHFAALLVPALLERDLREFFTGGR